MKQTTKEILFKKFRELEIGEEIGEIFLNIAFDMRDQAEQKLIQLILDKSQGKLNEDFVKWIFSIVSLKDLNKDNKTLMKNKLDFLEKNLIDSILDLVFKALLGV